MAVNMIPHVRNFQSLLRHRVLSPRCVRFATTTPTSLSKAQTDHLSKDDDYNREPIKFFGSRAATWRAKDTRSGGSDEALWYQPYVISGSLAIFLLYFCVLREENDIDRKLEGSLFDHIEGLEEQQLVISYKYNREKGLDTKEIEARLHELGIDPKALEQ